MASARKCDRCGAFYTSNTKHERERADLRKGICVTGIWTTLNNGVHNDAYYDLCDDCLDKLFAFLNEFKMDNLLKGDL